MTDNKKTNNNHEEDTRESIFQIMDNIMIQLSKTKKMFFDNGSYDFDFAANWIAANDKRV